jgi:hypothetical protein
MQSPKLLALPILRCLWFTIGNPFKGILIWSNAMRWNQPRLIILAELLLLSACGGGGGSSNDGNPVTQNPSPVTSVMLPADRKILWTPGVPGGIPSYTIDQNVKDVPYSAVGDGVADDTSAIQAAINACALGKAVLIPAGTYKISVPLTIARGVVVRGEGITSTKIVQSASNHVFSIAGPSTAYGWGQTHPEAKVNIELVSGFSKDSSTVVVSDASLISVGDLLLFDQLNDPSLVNQVGSEDTCTWCGLGVDASGNTDGSRAYGELNLVKAKSGNTLTLDHALYYDFKSQFNPRIVRITQGNTLTGAGVEDLCVTWSDGITDGAGFYFQVCAHCWLKNVESTMTTYKHVDMDKAYGCEIRDSYFHGVVAGYFLPNRGYGANPRDASTANLIENNIFYDLHNGVLIGSGGGSGNVVAYNYMDKTTHYQPNWWMRNLGTHGAHTYMNLWEGNELNKIGCDNTHGSGSHHVWFRNHANARTTCHQALNTIDLESWNYYSVFLGNVLNTVGGGGAVEQLPVIGFVDNPMIWRVGFPDETTTGTPPDPKVAQTMIKHGNWEEPTNAVQWNADIEDHVIPDSLYLDSKPAWFGDLEWPPIGPDVNGYVKDIPASVRFAALPQ